MISEDILEVAMKMKSQFKEIPGFEGLYSVSSEGRIWTILRKKFLKSSSRITNSGYETVCLWKGRKEYTKAVHWCVATAWLEKKEGKEYVNHKNGNKRDNRPENLEWVTFGDNMRHAYKNGLIVPYDRRGDRNPNSKSRRAFS